MQRYQKLLADRVISESQFRQYETNYNLQKEAVASAENNVALLKTGVSKGMVSNMIPATIDGTVLGRAQQGRRLHPRSRAPSSRALARDARPT
jgi:hypothetical protein